MVLLSCSSLICKRRIGDRLLRLLVGLTLIVFHGGLAGREEWIGVVSSHPRPESFNPKPLQPSLIASNNIRGILVPDWGVALRAFSARFREIMPGTFQNGPETCKAR